MVVDKVFLVLAVVATLALLGSFYLSVNLRVLSRRSRTGRIVFGTIASLKLFVLLILVDFYVAVWWPEWVSAHRQAIRLFLVVYLVVQTIGSLIALNRFRRYGDTR